MHANNVSTSMQHEDWQDNRPEITRLELDARSSRMSYLYTQFRQVLRQSLLLRVIATVVVILLCLLVPFLLVIQYQPFPATRVSMKPPVSPAPSSSFVNASESNGIVYINALDGSIAAYRSENGKLLWRKQFISSGFLVATSQALYRFTNPGANGSIEAIRAGDGSLLWSQQVPSGGPSPLEVIEGSVYFNSHEGVIYALRSSDGSILWRFNSGIRGPLDSILSVKDGVVAILSSDEKVYLLRAGDGSPIYHYQWQSEQAYNGWQPTIDQGIFYAQVDPLTMQARSINNGSLLWQYHSDRNTTWSPIEARGLVYVSTTEGSIQALRGKDGKVLWQSNTKPAAAPPAIDGQVAYFLMQNSEVVAVRTSDGTVLWHRQLPPLGEGLSYSPIVSEGTVYIDLYLPDQIVYALQASDGMIVWRHALTTSRPDFPPVVNSGIIYLSPDGNSIEVWRMSDGHLLWRYTSHAPLVWYPEVDREVGILYLKALNGTLNVFRMSDGRLLWKYP